MSSSPHERGRPAGRRALTAIALALGLLTFLFRLATLGGTLGGFDDDHFSSFAYAKQIQAGERPVRDFLGVSMQGVWPPLGFVASAGAQSLLGNNLRSEALLTAAAMGAGAALTFAGGALLAGAPAAAVGTILSVLLAPKLYAYPKVVLLSSAALLLIVYARRPSRGAAAALGALTAAAFLFRHDFAVYIAAGTAALLAASWLLGGVRPIRHGAVYAGVLVGLLAAPLGYVQRHGGLRSYFEFALENTQREAARTGLGSLASTMSGLALDEPALAWLVAVCMVMPFAAAAQALFGSLRGEPATRMAVLAIAAMAAVGNHFLLRGNVGARLGDVAPLAAVLGAVLAADLVRRGGRPAWRAWIRRVAAAAVLGASAASVWSVASVGSELRTAGWPFWPARLVGRALEASTQLAALPEAVWSDPAAADSMLVAQYVNACTHPRDRLLLLSYTPEILPFSGRLFAGGVAMLVITANTPDGDAFVLSRVQSQSVPIVLAEAAQLEPLFGTWRGDPYFPRLHAYLREAYADAGTVGTGPEALHVLATRGRVPNGTFRDTGLPCFR